jgi:hypothetical protein
MRGLSRRLDKLESKIPVPESESRVRFRDVLSRLSSHERKALQTAIVNMQNGEGTEEDRRTVQSTMAVAQERFDKGLILVRKHKPPGGWNEEIRMLRQTYGADAWRHASFYDEYLVPVEEAGETSVDRN